MQEIDCIFCQRGSDRVVIEEEGYQGRLCEYCRLIYVSPRPRADEIVDLYGHDDAHVSASAHLADFGIKQHHARHTIKVLSRHSRGGKFLEIGPGGGEVLAVARDAGFDPYALELNSLQADHIRDTLKIPCESTCLDLSVFDGQKFDVIYHCDVLSHFYDPIEEFKTIHQRLSDQGLMIFETGNFAEMDPKFYRNIKSFQFPDHLFFFGEKSVMELLQRSGFELVNINRYSILPELAFVKQRKKLQRLLARLPLLWRYNSMDGLRHFMRYTVGHLAPKKRRPQTMIIVARKSRLPLQ